MPRRRKTLLIFMYSHAIAPASPLRCIARTAMTISGFRRFHAFIFIAALSIERTPRDILMRYHTYHATEYMPPCPADSYRKFD